jgi:hypothetical protein
VGLQASCQATVGIANRWIGNRRTNFSCWSGSLGMNRNEFARRSRFAAHPRSEILVPSTVLPRGSGEALLEDRRAIGPGTVSLGPLVAPVFEPSGRIPLGDAFSPSVRLARLGEPTQSPVGVTWWRADSPDSGTEATLPTARASPIATSPPNRSSSPQGDGQGRGGKRIIVDWSLLAQTAHGAPSWPGARREPRVPARPDDAIRRDHGGPDRTLIGATSMR